MKYANIDSTKIISTNIQIKIIPQINIFSSNFSMTLNKIDKYNKHHSISILVSFFSTCMVSNRSLFFLKIVSILFPEPPHSNQCFINHTSNQPSHTKFQILTNHGQTFSSLLSKKISAVTSCQTSPLKTAKFYNFPRN